MTDVIRMRVGQTVKLRFIGTNNNFIHPMHVHGGPFEVVARDGELLPQDARFFADTINVGPGQRYDVIWTAAAFWQCYTTCLYARKDGIEVRSWHFLQRSKIADGLRLPAEERSCSGHHCNDGIWVMNGPKPTSALSPVASQLRTLVGAARRSHSCQQRSSDWLARPPSSARLSARDFAERDYEMSSAVAAVFTRA